MFSGLSRDKKFAVWAGMLSVLAVSVMIGIKAYAWDVSGSASIMASLIDSLVDAAVSLINLAAIRYAIKPADHEHRYGHGKVEGLAALFQAAFIAGGGVLVVIESVARLTDPQPLKDAPFALWAMGVCLMLTIVLVTFQRIAARRSGSLAVEADRAHYSGDVTLTAGVFVTILAQYHGGPAWLDPAFALGVVAWLGWTAYDIAIKGLAVLLDRELAPQVREAIIKTILLNPEVRGYHDLRTRTSGMKTHISFDIEIDPELTLRRAHAIAKEVERSLLALYPSAEIMIHQDPVGETEDSRHQVQGVHD